MLMARPAGEFTGMLLQWLYASDAPAQGRACQIGNIECTDWLHKTNKGHV